MEDVFLRSDDTGACAQFITGTRYRMALRPTCAMLFFEAPTRRVIVPIEAASAGMNPAVEEPRGR